MSTDNTPPKPGSRTKAEKQEEFLKCFADLVSITGAAKATGIVRQTVYDWLKDEEFREKYDETMDIAAYRLEEIALRRAFEGIIKPIIYKGRPLGEIRHFSDKLLITLLKARMPARYGTNTNADKPKPRPEYDSEREKAEDKYFTDAINGLI